VRLASAIFIDCRFMKTSHLREYCAVKGWRADPVQMVAEAVRSGGAGQFVGIVVLFIEMLFSNLP
jgi:hypothetical protein